MDWLGTSSPETIFGSPQKKSFAVDFDGHLPFIPKNIED
jgi:hypothetical protein